ncbi:MAG TPA: phasin family protein, partial [Candidatus Acidoferrum sp.]|nr:phasin family protein [Candidatus Acidoferrum sp.]
MLEFIKKAIFIGAGLASMTAEKIEEAVAEIVRKGEISEKQGRDLVQELKERSGKARKDLGDRVEKMIEEALQKLKIPTRKEVDELKARIERLEKEEGGR